MTANGSHSPGAGAPQPATASVAEPPSLLSPGLVAGWEGGGDAPAPGVRLRLAASRCSACGRFDFPVRSLCPSCHRGMEDAELGPRARLIGHTTVLHQPPGAQLRVPYGVGNALFDGGIALTGLLTEGWQPSLDADVEVVAVQLDDGSLTFGFRASGG